MDASGGYISRRTALAVLGRYVFFGPLIGGAPYVWTIIGIPFAYVLGAGPALVCGLLTLWWLRLGGTRAALPGPWHAAAFGALFGAVGAVVASLIGEMISKSSFDVLSALTRILYEVPLRWMPLFFIAPHAVVAGAIMAAWTVRRLAKPVPARPVHPPKVQSDLLPSGA